MTDVDPMVAVYRHDVHKLRRRSHEQAADEFASVRVYESVPCGADRDAALLSRPRVDRSPELAVTNHASPRRHLLITGQTSAATGSEAAVRELVRINDPDAMHRAWLASRVPARFNEAVYYPHVAEVPHVAGCYVGGYAPRRPRLSRPVPGC